MSNDYIPDWSDFSPDPRRRPYDEPTEEELRYEEMAMERRTER